MIQERQSTEAERRKAYNPHCYNSAMRDKNSLESMLDYVIDNVRGDYILDVGTGFGTVVKRLLRDNKKIVTLDPEGWTFPELEEDFENNLQCPFYQAEVCHS